MPSTAPPPDPLPPQGDDPSCTPAQKHRLTASTLLLAAFLLPGLARGQGNPDPPAFPTVYAFGDSITAGVGASGPAARYANLIAAAKGWRLTNSAVSGSQLEDALAVDGIWNTTVTAGGKSFMLTGYNDMRNFGTSQQGQHQFQDALYSAAALLAIPESERTFFYAGWSAGRVSASGAVGRGTIWGGHGLSATSVGSTVAFSFSGTALYLASARISSGGSFSLAIDGADRGRFDCRPFVKTAKDATYGPLLIRITGLARGRHTAVATTLDIGISGTSGVYYEWFAGLSGAPPGPHAPSIYVGNTLRMPAAGYAVAGPRWNKGSDTAVRQFNVRIQRLADDLVADGLKVFYVDVSRDYDPAVHCGKDKCHPNDAGMRVIADAFLRAMEGAH